MIEIISVKDIKDATPEELANLRRKGLLPAEETRRISGRPLSPYERTRAQVAATGNNGRWRTLLPHITERSYLWECIIKTTLLDLASKDMQNGRPQKE